MVVPELSFFFGQVIMVMQFTTYLPSAYLEEPGRLREEFGYRSQHLPSVLVHSFLGNLLPDQAFHYVLAPSVTPLALQFLWWQGTAQPVPSTSLR